MKELLILNEKKDINSDINSVSGIGNFLNEFENIYEILKNARPKSRYKQCLVKILARLYRYQYLIIILSLIIGIIFFAVPFIFIYIELFDNYAIPLFIICSFGFIVSLSFIIIPCIDSKKYKYRLEAKIERKNIVKNIGNILFYITLIISIVFVYIFFKNFLNHKEKSIKLDYKETFSYDAQILPTDFIFKYIIYSLLVDFNKTYPVRYEKIKMLYDDMNINILRYDFTYACIPLIVIIFFSLLKVFLIEVKQTVEKTIFFGALLILLIFQCFINSKELEYLKEKKIIIASFFQNSLIVIILVGYILWNINYTLRLIKKGKDKNFAIRRFNRCFIITIVLIDIITCFGYAIATLALLYCFSSFYYNKDNGEKFKHIYNSLYILKLGFIPIILGNSYYFGYSFLAMIFRPIASQFAPYELKNNNYVKSNIKLLNFMALKSRRRRFSKKLQKTVN